MICVRVMFQKQTWSNVNMTFVSIKNLALVKLESVGWKGKNISLSLYKGNYNSPTIIKYQSMISDIPNVETFHHSKIKNDNVLMNVNDNFISKELEINKILPEQQMSYSSYSVLIEPWCEIIRSCELIWEILLS